MAVIDKALFASCKKSAKMAKDFLEGQPSFSSFEYTVLPGFCDVHVHLREPGFSYKETIKSGTLASARGGYTAVLSMPNLNPVPDSVENMRAQLEIIERDAVIDVYPYGAITVGERGEKIADLEGMAKLAIAFSDDGRGVQSDGMMREAMLRAKALGKIIVAHCEVNELLYGGYIHDGEYARKNGHRGICSASEYVQVARDLELVREIGCKYHVCHVSTKESVALIRAAKREGLDVSCETAPHYLVMDEGDLRDEGRYKMNPPIRERADRDALIAGIIDGTVDMIATDHAPHSDEEKSRGLEGSPFGIVGIETAFPVMYTKLVKTGIITLERLVYLLAVSPRKRFGIEAGGFSVWCLDESFTVDVSEFLSKGHATPFEGERLLGVNYMTVDKNGKIAYKK